MYCAICGAEHDLTGPVRYWSPDDGWRTGRFCRPCYADAAHRRPRLDDYAYDRRRADPDIDEYIDVVYG